MHDERCDLVQRHSILPTGLQRERLGVRGEANAREAAEEPHHREVELAMAAVGRGVDQPAAAAEIYQPVAGPQVAVQPRRGFTGVERVEPAREPFEVAIVDGASTRPSRANRASGNKRFVA